MNCISTPIPPGECRLQDAVDRLGQSRSKVYERYKFGEIPGRQPAPRYLYLRLPPQSQIANLKSQIPETGFLSVEDTAEVLGVSRFTVYRLHKQGFLEGYQDRQLHLSASSVARHYRETASDPDFWDSHRL